MILIVIILLFIILSIIWYLLVRDVGLETFSERDNQILLLYGHKYVQGEKGLPLKLGGDRKSACYFVIDNPEHPDGIQLESKEHPGYLVCYRKGTWMLQSQYSIDNPLKTVFLPLNFRSRGKRNRVMLVCSYKRACMMAYNGRIVAAKYRRNPSKRQMLTFHKVKGGV